MNPLDVIWISDDLIKPPGPKMIVCVEPSLGFYFRINTNDNWEPCVPIKRLPNHLFLKHDSFIECTILDIDDWVINRSLELRGIIGRISTEVCGPLIEALGYAQGARRDRNAIRAVLERYL